MHSCDNNRCVNPSHLTVGTQAENIRDKCLKHRQARGARNAFAKLTDDRVKAIFLDYNSGQSISVIANREGVSRTTIERVLSGVTWTHVAVKKQRTYASFGEGSFSAKMTTANVAAARALYTGNRGETTALARRFGVSKSTMSRILLGKNRRRA